MMQEEIKSMFREAADLNGGLAGLSREVEKAVEIIAGAFRRGGKVLIAGNGGSASQASHLVAEFVGRYKIERKGLPAVALPADTSTITAWSNDYGFESVFERQVEALGKPEDVLISLSTSGNSQNLLKAVVAAKKNNIRTVALLGKGGGKLRGISEIDIIIPSSNTPRIQEAHLLTLHIICELVDERLFGKLSEKN